MAKLVVISVALMLSLLAVTATAERFDFFYLVQQWPGSFCDTRQGCCFPDSVKPAADFGIHGLWPNYANCRGGDHAPRSVLGAADASVLSTILNLSRSGTCDTEYWPEHARGRTECWPEYCDAGDALRPFEIRDLLASLDRNWGTLSCKNRRSFEFWSYEWRKHGTCANMGQHEYFASALGIKARHNLTSVLAAAGIVPSDTATYSERSVRDAIAEGTGFKANVECNRAADETAQLFQVYQCVDTSGKRLIDCPLAMRSKCTDRVRLPVF